MLSTPEPNLKSESGNIVFSHFQCQTTEIVRHMITSGKNKSCILDPTPASLSSACLDSLLPVITNIINLSLQTGYFAETWKTAVVCTSFKKPDFNLLFKNFRIISNARFVLKFTERVMTSQIQCHMITKNIFPLLQSAYRSHQSPETALLKVTNNGQGPCITLATAGFKCRLRHR